MKNYKDNSFNFLRFYVAIGVLLGHSTYHLEISWLGYTSDGIKPFYHIGVPFFFVLTGFLLYPSFSKWVERGGTLGGYLFNRFIRIAPMIYFYTISMIILLFILGALSINELTSIQFWAWIASNLVLLPVYHPDIFSDIGVGVLNGSLWTIFTFVTFYLFIPIIYIIEKRFGLRKMIVFILSTAILGSVGMWWLESLSTETLILKFYKVSFIPHLIFFGLGIILSKISIVKDNVSIFLICLVSVFLLQLKEVEIQSIIGSLYNLFLAFPLSYVVVWFGYRGPKIFRKFNKFEDLGMGIYVWHMVVINIILYLGINEYYWLKNPIIHVLVIVTTLIISYFSRVLVEKPFLKLKIKPNESKSIINVANRSS